MFRLPAVPAGVCLLLALLRGAAEVNIDAKIGPGRLAGAITISKSSTVIDLTGSSLPAASLPMKDAIGLPMSGRVSASMPPGRSQRCARSGSVVGSSRCSIVSNAVTAASGSAGSHSSRRACSTGSPAARAVRTAASESSMPRASWPASRAARTNAPVEAPTSSHGPTGRAPPREARRSWAMNERIASAAANTA